MNKHQKACLNRLEEIGHSFGAWSGGLHFSAWCHEHQQSYFQASRSLASGSSASCTKCRFKAISGRKHSEETKAKVSKANKGRKHTEEACAKMSAALTGRCLSEEHKAKLAELSTGRILTNEARTKISAALKGGRLSEEHKANLRGIRRSAETKAKLSKARKGTTVSKETRAKMSLTMQLKLGRQIRSYIATKAELRIFQAAVRNQAQNFCEVTNTNLDLSAHHMYDKASCLSGSPLLTSPLNGILLTSELHVAYHSQNGGSHMPCNPESLAIFLEQLGHVEGAKLVRNRSELLSEFIEKVCTSQNIAVYWTV